MKTLLPLLALVLVPNLPFNAVTTDHLPPQPWLQDNVVFTPLLPDNIANAVPLLPDNIPMKPVLADNINAPAPLADHVWFTDKNF